MSARVSGEVWEHSKADGVALLVLLAIADQAGDDGVTWLQVESTSGKKSITSKARCSRATAFRAVEKLVEMGELQVVQVRRTRSFINVYRVVVGRIAAATVDYDRLPFRLPHPFGSPSQSETVPTVSFEGVQGLKSERSGSHSATSVLIKDLGPSEIRQGIQEHPSEEREKTELAGLLETTLRNYVPLVEKAAEAGLDRVELAGHLTEVESRFASRSIARGPFTPTEWRALLGRFDELRGETPRQAYERWIDEKAADPNFDSAAVDEVMETWTGIDDVDRQELHERYEDAVARRVAGKKAAA